MAIGALISLLLLRFGYIHFASWILLMCLLASLILVLYVADGIHDMMILLFPISIMIASMLFDRHNLIAYSIIVFLSMQGFILGELNGLIHNSMSDHTSLLDMISVGILMFISTLLAYKMSENLKRSFLKANQNNIFLTENNIKLHNEMKERNLVENALKTKVSELEQYKKATVDRELKMIELKEKIIQLNREKGCMNETSQ
jgi:uncharacterized membrane protein YjfL (UPF0719 family)